MKNSSGFELIRTLFCKKNNKIFWLYALSFNALKKIRSSQNGIVINREKHDYCL